MLKTRKTLTDTSEYKRAYAAAIPDTGPYIEAARYELLQERHPGKTFFTQADQSPVDAQPGAIVRRAEHLSRSAQAFEAVEAPRLAAEAAEADRLAKTCPVCGEVRARVSSHWVTPPEGEPRSMNSCGPCAAVAQQELLAPFLTDARLQRVRAHLQNLTGAR